MPIKIILIKNILPIKNHKESVFLDLYSGLPPYISINMPNSFKICKSPSNIFFLVSQNVLYSLKIFIYHLKISKVSPIS